MLLDIIGRHTMKCSEIMELIEAFAPISYAYDWDNPGLLAGRMQKEVKRILVAVDATDEVVEQAIEQQVDMLITHHPLIFSPLKKVNDQNFISRRILKLIQADISYYAMHTNFDVAPGCMADLAAEYLQLEVEQPLEVTGECEDVLFGIGKIGNLKQPMTLKELGDWTKRQFGLPFVTVFGVKEFVEPLTRIAVSPGSGGSMVKYAKKAGVQVLITGDIGHHEGIDAVAEGLGVIDAGHYGLEHIFIPFMEEKLRQICDESVQIMGVACEFPVTVV